MIASIDDLTAALRRFAAERDWERYHSPKNLVMALNVEAAELMEHFQWLTQEESYLRSPASREAVSEELADVLIYLVRLADRLDIDLLAAAANKISKNARKYPAPADGSAASGTADSQGGLEA